MVLYYVCKEDETIFDERNKSNKKNLIKTNQMNCKHNKKNTTWIVEIGVFLLPSNVVNAEQLNDTDRTMFRYSLNTELNTESMCNELD